MRKEIKVGDVVILKTQLPLVNPVLMTVSSIAGGSHKPATLKYFVDNELLTRESSVETLVLMKATDTGYVVDRD